jgi:DNA polymerase-3 subunit delta'
MSPEAALDHPRHRFTLDGVEVQAASFDDSLRRGRLHHAWLLTGPEGIGKAAFAYRAARRLLSAKPDAASGALGASPDDAVSRMIAARSHPDLLVLERDTEVARKVIPVEEARRLPEFFAKAPALGSYRVAIIDAVDDFNANGANAVLKTLEEPSGRGVLFLISHAPGRLLPTIRSRCRTLAFRPWSEGAVAGFLEAAAVESETAARVAAMAGGSPGRALALSRADAATLDRVAEEIVAYAAAVPAQTLMILAESFRGGEGADRFSLFVDRLTSAVRRRAAKAEGANAARWAELWIRLAALTSRVEGLNLDRADAFWSTITDVMATARAGC